MFIFLINIIEKTRIIIKNECEKGAIYIKSTHIYEFVYISQIYKSVEQDTPALKMGKRLRHFTKQEIHVYEKVLSMRSH